MRVTSLRLALTVAGLTLVGCLPPPQAGELLPAPTHLPSADPRTAANEYAQQADESLSRMRKDAQKYNTDPLAGFTFLVDWAETELSWIESTDAGCIGSDKVADYRIAVKAFRELAATAQEGLRKGDLLVANLVERQTPSTMSRLDDAKDALRVAAASCR